MELLGRLFGSVGRLKMLRLFVFNKNAVLTAAEVAERTKLPRGTVRRDLAEFLAAGLVKRKGSATPYKYQTNTKFVHLPALDVFIRDTTSVRPERILAALKRAGTLRLVALSGIFTGVEQSQVDLIVVGDHLDERTLKKAVYALEAEIGREIRYASFTTADFRYRFGVYDRLLRDVFDYPHRLLIDKIGL
jgi:hypothetical protein